jgi:hypothetical protein
MAIILGMFISSTWRRAILATSLLPALFCERSLVDSPRLQKLFCQENTFADLGSQSRRLTRDNTHQIQMLPTKAAGIGTAARTFSMRARHGISHFA